MQKINEDKIIGILDDAMRLGAALGSFKDAGKENRIPYCPWTARAAMEAFKAAQQVFMEEIENIIRSDNDSLKATSLHAPIQATEDPEANHEL